MPKRVIKDTEMAWRFVNVEAIGSSTGRGRGHNPKQIRARLLQVGGREQFLLFGSSNDKFSFTLKWQDYDLARIDCGERHKLPTPPGERKQFVYGPHVHYYVAGQGLSNAYETDQYNFGDAVGALAFFLRHCNVVNPPALQETLGLV